jgi:hypothetical protein
MFDVDGMPHMSVVANGPLRMRVGDSVLFAIPASDLLRDGLVAGYDDIGWPTPARWIPDAPPERHITQVSEKTMTSTMVSMHRARVRHVGQALQGPRVGRLLLDCEGQFSELEVDAVALRTGVLVGRYPRCDLSAANARMSLMVSRVHALFIAIDETVHILDAGSSNGLVHDGRLVTEMALLATRPSTFELGVDVLITWQPG